MLLLVFDGNDSLTGIQFPSFHCIALCRSCLYSNVIRSLLIDLHANCFRCIKYNKPTPTLESFLLNSDKNIYSPNGVLPLIHHSTIRILNPHTSLTSLYQTLVRANLLDQSRLRPTWDSYFMHLADLAARRSNCMKRRVGCVLVRAGRVISTGYNGTPRGVRNCNEGGCGRCNGGEGSGQGLASCLCLHAEVDYPLVFNPQFRICVTDYLVLAVPCTLFCMCAWPICLLRLDNLMAGKRVTRSWKGKNRHGSHVILQHVHLSPSTPVIKTHGRCPCLTCSVKLVQVGVKEVVYSVSYSMDTQAEDVMRAGGVKVRQFSPPQEGLIW